MGNEQATPETRGVTVELLAALDLGPEIEGMAGRQLRMRMVTIEPGGVFGPIHDHIDRPGMVYILQGTITDHRDGVVTEYGPGVGWPEDKNTTHWLENRGTTSAVEISVDIVKITRTSASLAANSAAKGADPGRHWRTASHPTMSGPGVFPGSCRQLGRVGWEPRWEPPERTGSEDAVRARISQGGPGWASVPVRTPPDTTWVPTDQKVGSMQVEVWVPSPEPAVGVFTTAGTCQGRLRRHLVIGYAAP